MERSVDFTLRPDLWTRSKFGGDAWDPIPEVQSEALAWLDDEQRRINREIRAARKTARETSKRAQRKRDNAAAAIARGSPTAVMRALQVGERRDLPQYRHRSQLAPIAARMGDILDAEFEIGTAYGIDDEGNMIKLHLTVTRTK